MVSRKKLLTNTRTLSPQMIVYAASQLITRGLFSCRKHTKVQSNTFREHINFEAGFKEKVTVIATRPVSRFKFLTLDKY
jgi:hypothetical protein